MVGLDGSMYGDDGHRLELEIRRTVWAKRNRRLACVLGTWGYGEGRIPEASMYLYSIYLGLYRA